ncbi:hypothetical protein ATL39_2785 [Sinobaca qinghaiensis]|uniref:Uncharacterized protein n=1 Tax=Sinobaca qinghaiensis TaxID=342944 RepID=A0A419V0C9_9BACL|nr:hypothetical protein [Sinobaca qinghaiensis]RKD71388.1 hypothetical protein ATL39_2785 [Sinobaca qinghaiensis]
MKEQKIRNLEMIQTVILRMSSNCFALKGWTVALVAGVLALYGSNDITHQSIIIIFVPIIIFWMLDSYYLQLERKYRVLFEIVKEENERNF